MAHVLLPFLFVAPFAAAYGLALAGTRGWVRGRHAIVEPGPRSISTVSPSRLRRVAVIAAGAACASLGLSGTAAHGANAGGRALYPTPCGKAKPGSYYTLFVTRNTTCRFGRATYRAVIAEQDRRGGFVAAESVRFVVTVRAGDVRTTMRCTAVARAHGAHDFTCRHGDGAARVGVLLEDS